jgi:hypothetical protein
MLARLEPGMFKRIELGRLIRAQKEKAGFCRACGHRQEGVEIDARRLRCEACGLEQVYGAEEFIMMGWTN